jgi:uncharacterized protein YciI
VYVLVLFHRGPAYERLDELADAHERYVDSLIERRRVLLGGSFARTLGDVHAGYLLRCDSVEAAEALAAEDPYFSNGVFRPEAIEWELVGIDPRAID